MEIVKQQIVGPGGMRFSVVENGREVGRAFLYLMRNDIHEAPFGFMEDVFVEEGVRGRGFGKALVEAVIEEARCRGCYKLVATSRHSRPEVHRLYSGFGFTNWGVEFRIDFS